MKGACRTTREEPLHTDGGLLPALFGVPLAAGQAALQLVRHALVTTPAHRPQVHLHKLISGRSPAHRATQPEGKGGGRTGGGRKRGKPKKEDMKGGGKEGKG